MIHLLIKWNLCLKFPEGRGINQGIVISCSGLWALATVVSCQQQQKGKEEEENLFTLQILSLEDELNIKSRKKKKKNKKLVEWRRWKWLVVKWNSGTPASRKKKKKKNIFTGVWWRDNQRLDTTHHRSCPCSSCLLLHYAVSLSMSVDVWILCSPDQHHLSRYRNIPQTQKEEAEAKPHDCCCINIGHWQLTFVPVEATLALHTTHSSRVWTLNIA